jgi:hypothetical protein
MGVHEVGQGSTGMTGGYRCLPDQWFAHGGPQPFHFPGSRPLRATPPKFFPAVPLLVIFLSFVVVGGDLWGQRYLHF